jgi:hypothetical protein
MSSNVGLATPRGSGTSGYVQRNLSHLKPRDAIAPYPRDLEERRYRQRQPDKEILEHDRKRQIEVKCFELRDRLEEEEYGPSSSSFAFSINSEWDADLTGVGVGLTKTRLKTGSIP